MHKKLFTVVALLITATILLADCQSAILTETDCTKKEVLCVGLVTGLGGVNDKSFNQTAWEGVLKAQTDKVADWIRSIETVDSKDFDKNIATLSDTGYDIIVTVGDLYNKATTNAAKKYPNIIFIGVDQNQAEVLPNLVGLLFHHDQSGFLAGSLAAQMTKTNTIAAVLGTNALPSMVAFKEGYEAGAKFINPNISIISTFYPGDSEVASSDPRWGANSAAQAIQNGADVVFGAGGRTGYGALIETASHPDLYCIGVDTDQWETLPNIHPCLISSAMKLITPSVYDLIKLAKDGKFSPGNYFGASGLAPYHDFDSVIPQAVRDKVTTIAIDLNNGSLATGAVTP